MTVSSILTPVTRASLFPQLLLSHSTIHLIQHRSQEGYNLYINLKTHYHLEVALKHLQL